MKESYEIQSKINAQSSMYAKQNHGDKPSCVQAVPNTYDKSKCVPGKYLYNICGNATEADSMWTLLATYNPIGSTKDAIKLRVMTDNTEAKSVKIQIHA